jgi:hypothetical protein
VARERRFSHLVVGIAPKTGDTQFIFSIRSAAGGNILVVGKQVMQVNPGRNAECEQQQHAANQQVSYDGICFQ